MKVQDYKKKVESFDHLTDDKPTETIEEIVKKFLSYSKILLFTKKNSFGEMLHLVPLFMVLILKAAYLMMV